MLAVTLLAAGCTRPGDPGPKAERYQVVVAPGVGRATPTAGPSAAAVAALNRFAVAALRQAAQPRGNVALSPVGVAYVFAMLRAGAAGQTAAQLDRAFGFDEGTAAQFNALGAALDTVNHPTGPAPTVSPFYEGPEASGMPRPTLPKLDLADALFGQRDFALHPDFLHNLAEYFGTGVRTVDFVGDPRGAVDAINEWGRANTDGQIPAVLQRNDVDDLTRLALVNAIHLSATWAFPFNGPFPGTFTVQGTSVPVPVMRKRELLRYATGPGWQSVEVPYFGDRLALRVIIPTDGGAPAALLTPEVLAATGRATTHEVAFTMPLLTLASTFDLKALLRPLGVTDVFDRQRADLSGVADQFLYVSTAVQKATLHIDQYGTEASAVTVALGELVSGVQEVRADRPFAYEIVDLQTGAPLFLGQVTDPRAQ